MGGPLCTGIKRFYRPRSLCVGAQSLQEQFREKGNRQAAHPWTMCKACEEGLFIEARISQGSPEKQSQNMRFIISNWLTQLWRLAIPKLCRVSEHAGDSGEPIVLFLSESEGLRTRS